VDSAKAYAYCRALAATSPLVRVFTIGHSEEGREILLMAIADEAGIRELDRLKAATAALADPRRTDPAAADRLIQTARPIYYFNAVLHADETGSAEAMLEMAYRLAVSEQPMIQRIRQQLVVLLNPATGIVQLSRFAVFGAADDLGAALSVTLLWVAVLTLAATLVYRRYERVAVDRV